MSANFSLRVPHAILQCLPFRVRQWQREIGQISKNAYLVGLIRQDLISTVNQSAGLAVVARQGWYRDQFDELRFAQWPPKEQLVVPALLRRFCGVTSTVNQQTPPCAVNGLGGVFRFRRQPCLSFNNYPDLPKYVVWHLRVFHVI